MSEKRASGSSAPQLAWLPQLNAEAPPHGRVEFIERIPFGALLHLHRYRLSNGLQILTCVDKSAPVVAYHTWFRVGSRHERRGKTGLAHLFEHLMFNETEGRPAGEFDRILEEAGADSNASTWLDWTQYNISIPKDQLALVIGLESERMSKLVLKEQQVTSEKEVVKNERRYRVDDDVDGAISELLWANAFTEHAYHWPTIGWMADIEGFTTEDCAEFYRTYYSPNNALLVIVGDINERDLLHKLSRHYGQLPAVDLPLEDVRPEPAQTAERYLETVKPTATQKLVLGYKSPALGDFDYPILSLLCEVLFGGRASRVHQRVVRDLELASEVRGYVGPFRDPGLFEIFANARAGHSAEELLTVIEEELERVKEHPITQDELDRACARAELGLLASLETVDGKASTIGFYEAVLDKPSLAFERLEWTRKITPSDLRRVARRYLNPRERTRLVVRAQAGFKDNSETEAEEETE